jgi:hypothetical protein
VRRIIQSNSKQLSQVEPLLSIPAEIIEEISEYGLNTNEIIQQVIREFGHVLEQIKSSKK